jgi:hypothetical protein
VQRSLNPRPSWQLKKTGGDTAAEMNQAFMKSTNQEQWLKLDYTDENVRCLSRNISMGVVTPRTTTSEVICSAARLELPTRGTPTRVQLTFS